MIRYRKPFSRREVGAGLRGMLAKGQGSTTRRRKIYRAKLEARLIRCLIWWGMKTVFSSHQDFGRDFGTLAERFRSLGNLTEFPIVFSLFGRLADGLFQFS